MALDSKATVPKNCFAAADSWPPDIYVIPEHCFAVNVGDRVLALSGEHTELQWVSYQQAAGLLKWDSNRNALWELNERLKRTPNQASHAIAGKPGSA
jgi:dATP pyrophosphohydrolase